MKPTTKPAISEVVALAAWRAFAFEYNVIGILAGPQAQMRFVCKNSELIATLRPLLFASSAMMSTIGQEEKARAETYVWGLGVRTGHVRNLYTRSE